MQKRLVKIECLVLAQNFQILWAYYVQSSAKLFEKECREAAVAFLASYDELTKINPKINYQIISKFGFKTGPNDLFRQHSSIPGTPYWLFLGKACVESNLCLAH